MMYDFLTPLMHASLAYMRQNGSEVYIYFHDVTLIAFIIYLIVNVVCYLFLFHSTPQVLAEAALKTKNVMLLLPPDLLKYSESAQSYCREHISII